MSRREFPLGRKEPTDFEHVEKYPFSAPAIVEPVEKTLTLPSWHWTHDQGREGSCVGHGVAMERAITNAAQAHASRRYDPIALWRAAKSVDEWPSTKPEDNQGTSVRAAYQVTRDAGLCRVKSMRLVDDVPIPVDPQPANAAEGVSEYLWARTVDDVRAAISRGLPVVLGVNWYTAFDSPQAKGVEHWLVDISTARTTVAIGKFLGRLRGGHCVCAYAASDRRQAVKIKNSWGRDYPLTWLPYSTLERLLHHEHGEAALVSDR